MKRLALMLFVFAACAVAYATSKPWQTNGERQNGLNNGWIVVKFVAEDDGEMFPKFAFDPMVGDHVIGRSGQRYVIESRTFDLVKPQDFDSPSRFTIRLAREKHAEDHTN